MHVDSLLTLRCKNCKCYSWCANERRRSTSMQPVYLRNFDCKNIVHTFSVDGCCCVCQHTLMLSLFCKSEWILYSFLNISVFLTGEQMFELKNFSCRTSVDFVFFQSLNTIGQEGRNVCSNYELFFGMPVLY